MMIRKRGIIESGVVYIILNLLFFTLIAFFIFKMSSNNIVYEQTYSKQVALIIDLAKPNTTISLDISKVQEAAKENKKNIEDVFKINTVTKEIFVSLDKKGGYGQSYISDYNVSLLIDGKYLNILIK